MRKIDHVRRLGEARTKRGSSSPTHSEGLLASEMEARASTAGGTAAAGASYRDFVERPVGRMAEGAVGSTPSFIPPVAQEAAYGRRADDRAEDWEVRSDR
jgi:hypothetical protein